MIQTHFFKELKKWIEEMTNPTYTQTDFIYLEILKNVCSVGSMRQTKKQFNEAVCVDTLRLLSENQKLKEVPRCDTLNYYLESLSPDCLSELRKKRVTSLIRGK